MQFKYITCGFDLLPLGMQKKSLEMPSSFSSHSASQPKKPYFIIQSKFVYVIKLH
jgi:hypothetical protein